MDYGLIDAANSHNTMMSEVPECVLNVNESFSPSDYGFTLVTLLSFVTFVKVRLLVAAALVCWMMMVFVQKFFPRK